MSAEAALNEPKIDGAGWGGRVSAISLTFQGLYKEEEEGGPQLPFGTLNIAVKTFAAAP